MCCRRVPGRKEGILTIRRDVRKGLQPNNNGTLHKRTFNQGLEMKGRLDHYIGPVQLSAWHEIRFGHNIVAVTFF